MNIAKALQTFRTSRKSINNLRHSKSLVTIEMIHNFLHVLFSANKISLVWSRKLMSDIKYITFKQVMAVLEGKICLNWVVSRSNETQQFSGHISNVLSNRLTIIFPDILKSIQWLGWDYLPVLHVRLLISCRFKTWNRCKGFTHPRKLAEAQVYPLFWKTTFLMLSRPDVNVMSRINCSVSKSTMKGFLLSEISGKLIKNSSLNTQHWNAKTILKSLVCSLPKNANPENCLKRQHYQLPYHCFSSI